MSSGISEKSRRVFGGGDKRDDGVAKMSDFEDDFSRSDVDRKHEPCHGTTCNEKEKDYLTRSPKRQGHEQARTHMVMANRIKCFLPNRSVYLPREEAGRDGDSP